ncbi:hypothetical protein [Cohnella massiliensis]|uniref:hypothetical protein n=1 Tax=Cohnella massiliensis TaxID=1816691 RepID=UPI0009BB691B|nr:hypothetical protein [Cohnella massiliensis]
MKKPIVYALALTLVAASWAGNIVYKENSRLPEAGFLRHFIESDYAPNLAFDLFYVANKEDKRKPIHAEADELPALRFSDMQVHQQLRHQTIYKLTGYSDESLMEKRDDPEPLALRSVRVFYNDGTIREEEIGEIVVYRNAWPSNAAEPPVQMSSAGSGSDHAGFADVRTTKPVTLVGVSSRWLEKLGTYFEYEVKLPSDGEAPGEAGAGLPKMLKPDQTVSLKYRFRIPDGSEEAAEVYRLLLRERFREPGGEDYVYTVFADYAPSFTESEMRGYVREQRRRSE